jgi:hypothetical protein
MTTRARSATIHLNPRDQNMENLQSLLKKVGGILGCEACGRIAFLHIDTIGDPDPALAKLGATSIQVNQ